MNGDLNTDPVAGAGASVAGLLKIDSVLGFCSAGFSTGFGGSAIAFFFSSAIIRIVRLVYVEFDVIFNVYHS